MTFELGGLGPLRRGGTCNCCGAESFGTNGYVFEDPVKYPLACYIATFTPSHQLRSTTVSLGLGDWSEHSEPESRIAGTVMVRTGPEGLDMVHVEPETGVFGDDLVARRLTASEAAQSPLKDLLLRLAEFVATSDPNLCAHLMRAATPRDLWAWFVEQAVRLTWPPPTDLLEEFGEHLHAIHPGLAFELAKPDSFELAISAAGEASLFDLVTEIVGSAPPLSNTRVVAFRQRGPVAEFVLTQPDGRELSCEDIWFRLDKLETGLGLHLFVRDFPTESPGELQEAVYLLLDNAIGEYDVVTHIAGINWSPLPVDPSKIGLRPLVQLPNAFDRALERN